MQSRMGCGRIGRCAYVSRPALREHRAELAGSDGVESANAVAELGVGEPALTVERAEKICCAAFTFPRVAIHTAGNEVTVGVES
jgi:hypothetical protein